MNDYIIFNIVLILATEKSDIKKKFNYMDF